MGILTLAFNSRNTNELININLGFSVVNTPHHNNISDDQFSNLCDKDIDTNLPSKTCCKNYSITEFQTLKMDNNNLKIFHNNINGLEMKHDLLQNFLVNSSINFDIIAITETSLKNENNNFKTNICIEGYQNFSLSSKSNKGGSTIYAKSDLDILERTDLNISNDDYESIWLEIKNEKSKNIICGSVYRHPHNNNDEFNNFFNYLEVSLTSLIMENKKYIYAETLI